MESAVTQIGYVEIETVDEQPWLRLGAVIGFEPVAADGRDRGAGLRMDPDRWARIQFAHGETDRLSVIGWEAPSLEAYRAIRDRLTEAGANPQDRPELRRRRNVQEVLSFTAPDGVSGELYWGPRTTVRSPFHSPEHVTFVAGHMGMGHVTMAVSSFDETLAFYTGVLGLKLTEIADVGLVSVGFLRAGRRHHTLAVSELPDKRTGIDHVMVEVAKLDDLGAMRDRLLSNGQGTLQRDLGRHPTDEVISMYIETPAPFTLEVGWGSVEVDDESWPTERYNRSGWAWGHRKPDGNGAGLGQ